MCNINRIEATRRLSLYDDPRVASCSFLTIRNAFRQCAIMSPMTHSATFLASGNKLPDRSDKCGSKNQ